MIPHAVSEPSSRFNSMNQHFWLQNIKICILNHENNYLLDVSFCFRLIDQFPFGGYHRRCRWHIGAGQCRGHGIDDDRWGGHSHWVTNVTVFETIIGDRRTTNHVGGGLRSWTMDAWWCWNCVRCQKLWGRILEIRRRSSRISKLFIIIYV